MVAVAARRQRAVRRYSSSDDFVLACARFNSGWPRLYRVNVAYVVEEKTARERDWARQISLKNRFSEDPKARCFSLRLIGFAFDPHSISAFTYECSAEIAAGDLVVWMPLSFVDPFGMPTWEGQVIGRVTGTFKEGAPEYNAYRL